MSHFSGERGRALTGRVLGGRIAIATLIGLIGFGCAKSPEDELAGAQTAYEKNDFTRALSLSESVLKKIPSSFPAHRIKMLSAIAQGEVLVALDQFDLIEKRYPEAAPQLLKEISLGIIKRSLAHENGFVRSAAVKALGEMGDPAHISLMIPGLRDKEVFARFFTVEALGMLGGSEALKLLLALGSDPEGMVRIAAVKALDDMPVSDSIRGVDMHQAIATFKNDSDPSVRLFSLAAMARRKDSAAFATMAEMIQTPDPLIRQAGAVAMGRTRENEAIPLLIKILSDPNETLRMYAAEALGEFSRSGPVSEQVVSPEGYATLAHAMKDKAPAVRGAAATSLGKLGNPKAIPHLTAALADPDVYVRVSAAEGLYRLGKKALSTYEAAMTESDYAARHFAIGSLRKVGGKEALPLLAKGLGDTAPRVRIAVVRAIGEIGEEEAIPLLKAGLKDPDLSVRTYAAGNVGRILNKRSGLIIKNQKGES